MNDIIIIGAGPIGSYVAYLLAKQGKKVEVYEEHKKIGKPVQCAGIVTSSIKNVLDFSIESCIKNKIKKIEVHSKNHCIEFNLKNLDFVLDREKFDKLIYKQAKVAGAKFHLGKKVTRFEKNKIIIGADGPLSMISKLINKNKNQDKNKDKNKNKNKNKKHKISFAVQARVKTRTKIKDKNKVIIFLKSKSFVWFIPESSNVARIGMIGKNIKELMLFIKEKYEYKILEYQSGILPCYVRKKVHQNNLFIVGDAAGHIKETTYGGIVPGLRAAKILTKSIIECKNYEKELKKLKKELWIHHKIREFLDKFSEKDYDLLVKLAKRPKVKRLFEKVDRDNIIKIISKLFFIEPRFLYFFLRVFRVF